MLERYARLTIDSPRQIILAVALVTLIISPFILKVEFSTDVQAFLPQSDEVETYDKINEDFGRDSSVVNLYLVSSSNGNVLSMNNLVDILQIHNDCLQVNGVESVLSVSDFFNSALMESGLSLSTVKDTEEPWQLVFDSISSSGSGNYTWTEVDFVSDVLVNKDLNLEPLAIGESEGSVRKAPIANSTIIMVNLDPDLSTDQKKEVGQKLRTLADQHNQKSGSDISAEAFSVDLLAADVDESTQYTNILMSFGMLLVTVLLLWLTFRHWSYVVLPVITLILSIFWTFSFAGMMGIKMTALDVAVIPLVVGLGIDFSVHLSRRYQEGISAGHTIEESMLESQLHTGQALSLAMFTTVIAFLSGITGGVGPVRDFSLLCAFGIFSSFILTLFFYTSMRYLLDSSSEQMNVAPHNSVIIENSIYRASQIVDKHPQAIISTVIVLTIFALGGASQIETSFSLDDFLSNELEIMVTADKIQSDFRGASYSQSQILIQGEISSTDFINGSFELQNGISGSDNNGLNDDRYVIRVGSSARVESVHEIVKKAIDSEDQSINAGQNLTHEWYLTDFFRVNSGSNLEIYWDMEEGVSSPSLEVVILWYNESNELIGTEKLTTSQISADSLLPSKANADVINGAHKSRVKFSYLQDIHDESLVENIAIYDQEKYVFVQSIIDTFNLTHRAKTFSSTTDLDIKKLYDYLYVRDLDVADPFTGETYSDKIKHVLNRNDDGEYVSSVFRMYIGPKPNYELDNDGLEFMRAELKENIPEIFDQNFTVSTTGGHVLTSVTVNEIQKTQISSTLIAILFAALILVAIYRSVNLGIIAVFPTILASVWIMATMTLLGITLNVLTVMVTALTIGLGIDYAIHIVERYREEIAHKTESQAIETTIVRTGSALLISGLTTICGFAVLFMSPMPLVRNFGIITAATILYSMFIAIFVLPSLIWISNRIREWMSNQTLD